MFIVRNEFIAKPGSASKLAAQLKKGAAAGKLPKARILTDVSGDLNRVVMEYSVDKLSDWEATMKDYGSNDKVQKAMKGYTELYLTARREILKTT